MTESVIVLFLFIYLFVFIDFFTKYRVHGNDRRNYL